MSRYYKRDRLFEAVWFPGHMTPDLYEILTGSTIRIVLDGIEIVTPEGIMLASPGDWIVRDVKGDAYPCKPDIFSETYQAVKS